MCYHTPWGIPFRGQIYANLGNFVGHASSEFHRRGSLTRPKSWRTWRLARVKCTAPSHGPEPRKWTARWRRPSVRFPAGLPPLWPSGRPVWTSWRTRSSGTRPCLQKRRPETTASRCPLRATSTVLGRRRTSGFTPRAFSIREPEPRHGRGSHQLHLAQAVGGGGLHQPLELPLYLFTWKVAPALAAGNCVVATELTRHGYLLSTWIEEAAFLLAFNVLHGLGPEVGEAMVTHPDIAAVSFTGGTQTGARIGHVAPKFKKMSLSWAGRTPPSFLPMPTSTRRSKPRCAVRLRTKVKSACADLESWSNARSRQVQGRPCRQGVEDGGRLALEAYTKWGRRVGGAHGEDFGPHRVGRGRRGHDVVRRPSRSPEGEAGFTWHRR